MRTARRNSGTHRVPNVYQSLEFNSSCLQNAGGRMEISSRRTSRGLAGRVPVRSAMTKAAALIGFLLLLVATFVSYLDHTAQLPAVLTGDARHYWTSLNTVAGFPIEFLGALWFLVVIAVQSERQKASYASLDLLLFWSGAIATGVGAGLSYRAGIRCLPIMTATVIAAWICLTAAFRSGPLPANSGTVGVWSALKNDWTVFTSRSTAVVKWLAAGAGAGLVAQHMALAGAATTSVDRDAQLARWYASQPRVVSDDLVMPGKIRIVVFSDYQCPGCSFEVPEYETIANRYRNGGYEQVELITRDFPLNPDCNPAVQVRIHPAACGASAAVRFLKRIRGEHEAQTFAAMLYRKHGKFSNEDIERHLASVGLADRYKKEYTQEIDGVRKDALLGDKVGVSGTPTVFIDGRLVRNLQPHALETIIDYNILTTSDSGKAER